MGHQHRPSLQELAGSAGGSSNAYGLTLSPPLLASAALFSRTGHSGVTPLPTEPGRRAPTLSFRTFFTPPSPSPILSFPMRLGPPAPPTPTLSGQASSAPTCPVPILSSPTSSARAPAQTSNPLSPPLTFPRRPRRDKLHILQLSWRSQRGR